MTLKQWCNEYGRDDYLRLWDPEKNQYGPDEVNARSKKTIYIMCPRGIHESRAISCDHLTKRKKCICKKCNSFGQSIIDKNGEKFLSIIWSDKNSISPFDIPRSSRQYVWLRCIKNRLHGEYSIMCNTYTNSTRYGCPKCHVGGKNGKAAWCDSIAAKRPEYKTYWAASNTLNPDEITLFSHKSAMWKCPAGLHEDFQRSIAESVRYDFRCPVCSALSKTSMLQNKVNEYLISLGYSVLHEYQCSIIPERKWVKCNRFLPCDNEVVELKLIIEVHGKQHYAERSWHDLTGVRNGTSSKFEFMMQKKRDMYKKWYIITHGYEYLEIPYTAEDGDKYRDIIMNKIHEITAKESVTTTA